MISGNDVYIDVYIVYLDFCKTFHCVPQQRVLSKLKSLWYVW